MSAKQPPAGARDAAVAERVAVLTAHRACHSAEHDPANGRIHGYCIVCGIPFPCEYVGEPPAQPAAPGMGDAIAVSRADVASMVDVANEWGLLHHKHVRADDIEQFQYSPAVEELHDKLKAALAAQPAPVLHPDDAAVDAFAVAMKEKLAAARAKGRGGWDDTSDPDLHQHLSNLLREHVEKGDPRDVANFCMFLHQRGESILPTHDIDEAQPAPVVGDVGAMNTKDESLLTRYGIDYLDGWNSCRDAMLAARPGGESVGEMLSGNAYLNVDGLRLPDGTKLYAHPAQAGGGRE